jgi:hypothetical protein
MKTFQSFFESKFQCANSSKCGHCSKSLYPSKVAINPEHIYPIGMLFVCFCAKSRMWTNSIRSVKNLTAFLTGETPRYMRGFCNDEFCGYCGKHIKPLENGVNFMGKNIDRYGCPWCPQNQAIMCNSWDKTPEDDTAWLVDWYGKRQDEIENPIKLL